MGDTKFSNFDTMDRTLKCDNSFSKLLSITLLWCCLFFNFIQFENLSILDLALSGVNKGSTISKQASGVHPRSIATVQEGNERKDTTASC